MELWPLLTSHSSLLLREFFPACEISPGTHTLFHSHTRLVCRKRFRAAIGLWLVLQSYPRLMPDKIPFRRARALPMERPFNPPNPAFFRFRLADGHPSLWLTLPAAGRVQDVHPIERALTGRKTAGRRSLRKREGSDVRLYSRFFESAIPDSKRFETGVVILSR